MREWVIVRLWVCVNTSQVRCKDMVLIKGLVIIPTVTFIPRGSRTVGGFVTEVTSQTSASWFWCVCSSDLQEGQQLIQEKPELSLVVRKKLEEIRECWQDLESTTQAKARQLFEANKADLLVQSYESLDQRLGQLEGQLVYVDQGQDLTSVNKQLKKLQVWTSFSSVLAVSMSCFCSSKFSKKSPNHSSTLKECFCHIN